MKYLKSYISIFFVWIKQFNFYFKLNSTSPLNLSLVSSIFNLGRLILISIQAELARPSIQGGLA